MTLLMLTLNPIAANPSQPRQEARTSGAVQVTAPSSQTGRLTNRRLEQNLLIRAWCSAYALRYGIEPAAAMSVAKIESSKGKQEFRTGLVGRYYLPMGIYKGCRIPGVADLETNIRVGVSALARYGPIRNDADLRRSLKRYNASFDESYWRAIVQARNHYRQKGVSE